MYWMFSILADRASRPFNPKTTHGRFCLPGCLLSNPFLLWHLSVEQNIRFVNGTPLFSGPFLHFHISRPSFHHTPWWDTVYTPVTKDEWLMKKKIKGGCPELWKDTGQDFLWYEWMETWHRQCLMDKDQSQAENTRLFIWSPPPLVSNRRPRQKRREFSSPASLKDLTLITRHVCSLASCTSITPVSFSSLRYTLCCFWTGTFWGPLWTSDKDSPGENELGKQTPSLYLENPVSVCLSLLQEPAGVGFSVLGLFNRFWSGRQAYSTTKLYLIVFSVWHH